MRGGGGPWKEMEGDLRRMSRCDLHDYVSLVRIEERTRDGQRSLAVSLSLRPKPMYHVDGKK